MLSASHSASKASAFRWRAWRESALLLLLAALAALLVGSLHPRHPAWRLPYPGEVSVQAANAWRDALWVDARSDAALTLARIGDAVSLNEDRWESLLPGFLEKWRPGRRVVVYCDSRGCGASFAVARRLQRELRIDHIYTLKGGWAQWQPQAK